MHVEDFKIIKREGFLNPLIGIYIIRQINSNSLYKDIDKTMTTTTHNKAGIFL